MGWLDDWIREWRQTNWIAWPIKAVVTVCFVIFWLWSTAYGAVIWAWSRRHRSTC